MIGTLNQRRYTGIDMKIPCATSHHSRSAILDRAKGAIVDRALPWVLSLKAYLEQHRLIPMQLLGSFKRMIVNHFNPIQSN